MNIEAAVQICMENLFDKIITSQDDSSIREKNIKALSERLQEEEYSSDSAGQESVTIVPTQLYHILNEDNGKISELYPKCNKSLLKDSDSESWQRLIHLTRLLSLVSCAEQISTNEFVDECNQFLRSNTYTPEDFILISCSSFEIGKKKRDFNLLHDSFLVAYLSNLISTPELTRKVMITIGEEIIQLFECEIEFKNENCFFVQNVVRRILNYDDSNCFSLDNPKQIEDLFELDEIETFILMSYEIQKFHEVFLKKFNTFHMKQLDGFNILTYSKLVTSFQLHLLNPLIPNTRILSNFKELFYLSLINSVRNILDTLSNSIYESFSIENEEQVKYCTISLLQDISNMKIGLDLCVNDLNRYHSSMKHVNAYDSYEIAYSSFCLTRRGKKIDPSKDIYDFSDSDSESFISDPLAHQDHINYP